MIEEQKTTNNQQAEFFVDQADEKDILLQFPELNIKNQKETNKVNSSAKPEAEATTNIEVEVEIEGTATIDNNGEVTLDISEIAFDSNYDQIFDQHKIGAEQTLETKLKADKQIEVKTEPGCKVEHNNEYKTKKCKRYGTLAFRSLPTAKDAFRALAQDENIKEDFLHVSTAVARANLDKLAPLSDKLDQKDLIYTLEPDYILANLEKLQELGLKIDIKKHIDLFPVHDLLKHRAVLKKYGVTMNDIVAALDKAFVTTYLYELVDMGADINMILYCADSDFVGRNFSKLHEKGASLDHLIANAAPLYVEARIDHLLESGINPKLLGLVSSRAKQARLNPGTKPRLIL